MLGMVISRFSKTCLEIEGIEVPIACPFKSVCVVWLFRNHARNFGNTLLLVGLITKNEVEATEGSLWFSKTAAKFLVPLAAKSTSPSFSRCFSEIPSAVKSG